MTGRTAGRLGKGLSSLLGEQPRQAATPVGGDGGRLVNVEELEPGPFQPRGPIAPETIEELAASIRRAGVLQPLLVRPHPRAPGRFEIIAGERRWRAAQRAGLQAVPVVVRELGDADAMAAALIENLQREDLNPVEEARGYRRLVDEFGLTHQALAEALGRSRAHLSNTLRLLQLPPAVLDDLAAGRLSAGHARALLAAAQPEPLAREVMQKGLSVRQTEARVAQLAAPASAREAAPGFGDDPDVRSMVGELSAQLGLRVRIEGRGGRGRVVVEFDDLAQLDGVVALLMARDR